MKHGDKKILLHQVNSVVMDYKNSIIYSLRKFLDKRKSSSILINLATIENELIISIINGNKIKRFKDKDSEKLIDNLRLYLKVN